MITIKPLSYKIIEMVYFQESKEHSKVLANYYKRFVKDFAKIAKLLYIMMK